MKMYDRHVCSIYVKTSLSMQRKDFLIFDTPGRSPYYATENHFKDVVMLCYIHSNHYDVIYPRQRLSAAAMCQSIVYETLYKTVFEFGDDVDLAVKKMLYDKSYFKHKKNMTFEQWKESVKFGTETNVLSDEEQVRLTRDLEGHSASFQAHIQKMEPNEGPITVFIEKLGKIFSKVAAQACTKRKSKGMPSSYSQSGAQDVALKNDGAPSPDVVCSPPQNGILSHVVTPSGCASDTTPPYGQEIAPVQQPQQQPQHLVASYSPMPFTNMLFSCEPPAPTVNLAAQRSNDPEGSDLPSGKCDFFFFLHLLTKLLS
ncbi:hypothetical protein HPB50_018000 [Hyalomma asiaticum]|uniref:Uncharacterized protein n=1 Tax=Hyalomma asiaticum TaxID=266040 RepID=A0ACB7SRC4_HYAAI|nr:hypothetical protein HPB50_018000 [Hyalomma asiaticum]